MAVRGEDRIAPFHHPPGFPACGAHRPYSPLGPHGVAVGVCHPPLAVGCMPSDKDDHVSIVGDADRGEVVSVVVGPVREFHRLEAGSHRCVDVPSASLHRDPGDAVHVLGRNHLRRVRRAQDVLEGKVLGLRCGSLAEGQRKDQGDGRQQTTEAEHGILSSQMSEKGLSLTRYASC